MSNIAIKKEGKSVLVGAFVPVGSRDEDPAVKGISHFVEHMLFKGTKNRTKDQIKKEIEQYGALFNAWTAEEHTFYYVQIDSQYADVARKVVEDMVHNATFPVEEVDSERSVIVQELQMYEDNPQMAVLEQAQRAVFKPESGLHVPIIGTRETLAAIDREKLAAHYARMYKNPITIEVGDTEEAEAQMLLPKKFAPEVANLDSKDVIVPRKGINQANMVLTGLLHFDDPIRAYYDMDLYSSVMNGFTGRLFDTIREKNGLVYHVGFYYQLFSCGTVWYYVYAALEPNKIDMARALITAELTRPVSPEELSFAKKKLMGQNNLASDDKSNIGKIIIGSTINHMNYQDVLKNSETHIETSAKTLNTFIANAQFNKAKLVAVIPEK
jgi:predicted Zn-dependent peptidase